MTRFAWIGLVLALWLAVAVETAWPRMLALGPADPNFALGICIAFALSVRPALGSLVGFFGGAAIAAISGVGVAGLATSFALGGFVASWLQRVEIEVGPAVAGAFVAVGSFTARLGLLVLAPQDSLGVSLGATIISALYDGVLALPAYAAFQAGLRPKEVGP